MASFDISIALVGFENILNLCRHGAGEQDEFWFSWNLFGKTFQSETFAHNCSSPSKFKDMLHVQCDKNVLVTNLEEPLRICLCSSQRILAVSTIPLTHALESNIDDWFDVCLVQDEEFPSPGNSPSIKVLLSIATSGREVTRDSIVLSQNGPVATIERMSMNASAVSASISSHQSEVVGKALDYSGVVRSSVSKNDAETRANDGELAQSHDASPPIRELNPWRHVHYRLSVEVRSIGAMKRAAHVLVNFAYSHVGSTAQVRSKPCYVRAHSEVTLEDRTAAAATYDFCLAPQALNEIFVAHPLKIVVLNKSHLGTEAIGNVSLSLRPLMQSSSLHSVRCPISNKSFPTIDHYDKYRKNLLNMRSKRSGLLHHLIPPPNPIKVHTVDVYQSIISNDGVMSTVSSNKLSTAVGRQENGKLRVILVLEEMGVVEGMEYAVSKEESEEQLHTDTEQCFTEGEELPEEEIRFVPTGDDVDEPPPPPVVHAPPSGLTGSQSINPLTQSTKGFPGNNVNAHWGHIQQMKWEDWRKDEERKWKDSLQAKELELHKTLQNQYNEKLAGKLEGVREAHEDVSKLELRLKESVAQVDRQKSQLQLQEEQVNMKLVQKTAELQLLQRRIRDEAKAKLEAEQRKCKSLESQVSMWEDDYKRMEKRALEAEQDYEKLRQISRNSSETLLREEISRYKTQLFDAKNEVTRERELCKDMELQREHFRSQVHRVSLALKKEREKSSVMARQELEQLRLEFLAREERYVLDGDREELRLIRQDVNNLKQLSAHNIGREEYFRGDM